MSLRSRLVVVLLGVVCAGLAVANVATYSNFSSFLNERVDQQLAAAQFPVASELFDRIGHGGTRRPRAPDAREIVPGTYGELRDTGGGTIVSVVFSYVFDDVDPPPALPESLPGTDGDETASIAFTTKAVGSDLRYRVLATATTDPSGTLIVAVPLRDVNQTLSRLLRTQVVVALVVLAALGLLSWQLVRVGLRPLNEMERTADAIAAGNLSERVPDADPRTEVGRVGSAFNAMLARIEGSFAERQAAEDRLRRFVADASHELRTPLTSIQGYAELFRRGADRRPEDLAKVMRRIEEEAQRMGGLVNDLLLLARLDEGQALDRRPVDLVRLAADSVDDARAVDPTRPITLTQPDVTVEVSVDEARIRQVIANLMANARIHTPPGTAVDVTVGWRDTTAVLEVRDHGNGLPAGEEERVFDRFFRADAARSRASGGSGLGLSIVAAVVDAHGGRVNVDNEPGRGVSFRVELPATGASTVAEGQPVP